VAKRKLPRGWTEGSAQELLGLSDGEAAIVEIRIRLAEKLRERRTALRITQAALAKRIQSTQPRIARLEQADGSIEMLLRALFALGSSRKEIARLLAA
jgi:hypothetical protein